jgi:hypothetical protein
MAKTRVTFRITRIAEGDWAILAERPGAEPITIKGLVSKADADDWMNGDRKIAWLRAQGYAK